MRRGDGFGRAGASQGGRRLAGGCGKRSAPPDADRPAAFRGIRHPLLPVGDRIEQRGKGGRHRGGTAGAHVHIDADVLAGGRLDRLAAGALGFAEQPEEGVEQLLRVVEKLVGDEEAASGVQLPLVGDMVLQREGGAVVVVVVPKTDAGQHVLRREVEGPPVIDDIHVAVAVGPVRGDLALVDQKAPLRVESEIVRQAERHGPGRIAGPEPSAGVGLPVRREGPPMVSSSPPNSAPRRRAALLLLLALLPACFAPEWPPPPETRVEVVTDTLHGVGIADPYRWLEDQESPETRAWLDTQNEYARLVVSDRALEARVEARLRELMDAPAVGAPREAGEHEVFTLRRAGERQARIHIRPRDAEAAESGRRPDPEGDHEVLLDPAELGVDAFASLDIVDVSPDGSLLLYRIRDGGLDEISVRLFDLETREERPDRLPEALYGTVTFDGSGDGFYYVERSREHGPRARRHTIGTPAGEDREIFGEGYGPETFLRLEEIAEGRLLLLSVQHGWMRNEIFVMEQDSGEVHPVLEGERAHATARAEEGRLLLMTNLDAPRFRVLQIPTEGADPSRWSDRSRWTGFLPEQEHLLRGYTTIGDRTYANLLADVSSRILVFAPAEEEGGPLEAVGEVPLPPHHTASLEPMGEDGAVLTLSSFTTPATRYRLDLETFERERIEPPRPEYDGEDILVEQVRFSSADGTEAPMYLMRRRDVAPDGNLPTLLHGYGGFNVSVTPAFRAQAAVWVEAGGVFAVATLRGGGEFGEDWHRAGMLENKQNVFDDFIAAAEWLIENGVTNPDRLAITGASNGGLLVASSFTQRPELFRAVFCGFPDLDMVRFFTFTETNNMPALLEYGNAGIAEQFEFLRRYSPYQAVRDGTDYPAVMLTQGDLDTRVPPLQARKMTARLQAATSSGLPVILRYHPRAGHAGGRRRVEDRAMETAFLMMQLGVTPPE